VGVRLLAAGVALLAVIVILAVMAEMSSEARRVKLVPPSSSSLARILNEGRDAAARIPGQEWAVVRANSAHQALMVDVEAQRLDHSRAIATHIVKQVRPHRYAEILIYVRPPRSGINAAMRRVQWTPRGGFLELMYDALP
jgi:hypothetical protein